MRINKPVSINGGQLWFQSGWVLPRPIVGLLSAFGTGRDIKKGSELSEFIAWLTEHNHNHVVREIQRSQAISVFIKAFLNQEMPEIHTKLDAILALVQSLIERQGTGEEVTIGTPLNEQYGRRMITFLFEQFQSHRFTIKNFGYAFGETESLLGQHLKLINRYVLEKMVRECLTSKSSATKIVHKHWPNLIA